MKQSKFKTIIAILFYTTIQLASCTSKIPNKEEEIVQNEGKIVVENGKGAKDTIPFKCVGCKENLSINMFEKVKNRTTEIAKSNLNNPLSFKPISVEFYAIKDDSLYEYESNKKIDSAIYISAKYQYIGQNAYGTEMSGEQTISFYIIENIIEDNSERLKLENLEFNDEIINRTLLLTRNEKFIEIIPTKDKIIIAKTSLSCVDEGTWLILNLSNNEEIKLISWNKFNCEGKSYFKWFTAKQLEKIKSNNLESIMVVGENSVAINVPKNCSDYFIQLINLYK